MVQACSHAVAVGGAVSSPAEREDEGKGEAVADPPPSVCLGAWRETKANTRTARTTPPSAASDADAPLCALRIARLRACSISRRSGEGGGTTSGEGRGRGSWEDDDDEEVTMRRRGIRGER